MLESEKNKGHAHIPDTPFSIHRLFGSEGGGDIYPNAPNVFTFMTAYFICWPFPLIMIPCG